MVRHHGKHSSRVPAAVPPAAAVILPPSATTATPTAILSSRGHQTLAAAASLPGVGATPVGVRHARTLERERLLQVEWEDGTCSLYPFTWLRDNCQCPHCTLQSAQARSLLLADLDVHTGIDSVQLTDNNKVSSVLYFEFYNILI